MEDIASSRLAIVWKNDELSVFVDGKIHKRINKLHKRSRSFYSLNYNPVRKFKTAISVPKSTQLSTVIFKDQAIDDNDLFIKGSVKNYFINCFQLKSNFESSLNPSSQNSNQACKSSCDDTLNQVTL